MQLNELTTKEPKFSRPSLPTLLSVAAAFAAFGTVTLHFLGEVAHRAYLSAWGIDPGLFPKAADWLLVNGYYVLFDRFFAFLRAAGSNLLIFAAAAVGAGLYVFVLLTPLGPPSTSKWEWFQKLSPWIQRLIRQTSLTALVIGLLPLALIVVTAFMAIPAIVGETAGRSLAEREESEYLKGCSTAKYSCVEVMKDGATIATGFILESSVSHMAIFDTGLKRGRLLSREGTQVLTRSALKPKD
jgi:hypothetical protein